MQRIHLSDRSVLRLSGPDTQTFLQGLISNDVSRANGAAAVYAALLTPQGKFLYDFFVIGVEDGVLLECRAEDVPAFSKKLRMYKLRSDVELTDESDAFAVYALIDGGQGITALADADQQVLENGAIVYRDPRLDTAGARALLPSGADSELLGGTAAEVGDYQQHRTRLGLPEAPIDLQAEKSILLESGFDELNGVDWDKGCYMGQELTARTKYRGLVKKRLVPVELSGSAESGSDLMLDGKVVGDLRSVTGQHGIAMIRLQALIAGQTLKAGEADVKPLVPNWMRLPEDA